MHGKISTAPNLLGSYLIKNTHRSIVNSSTSINISYFTVSYFNSLLANLATLSSCSYLSSKQRVNKTVCRSIKKVPADENFQCRCVGFGPSLQVAAIGDQDQFIFSRLSVRSSKLIILKKRIGFDFGLRPLAYWVRTCIGKSHRPTYGEFSPAARKIQVIKTS